MTEVGGAAGVHSTMRSRILAKLYPELADTYIKRRVRPSLICDLEFLSTCHLRRRNLRKVPPTISSLQDEATHRLSHKLDLDGLAVIRQRCDVSVPRYVAVPLRFGNSLPRHDINTDSKRGALRRLHGQLPHEHICLDMHDGPVGALDPHPTRSGR